MFYFTDNLSFLKHIYQTPKLISITLFDLNNTALECFNSGFPLAILHIISIQHFSSILFSNSPKLVPLLIEYLINITIILPWILLLNSTCFFWVNFLLVDKKTILHNIIVLYNFIHCLFFPQQACTALIIKMSYFNCEKQNQIVHV